MERMLKKLGFFHRYTMITFGITLMVMGLYFFIMPASWVIGGVSGVGVLFHELLEVRVSLVTFILNALMLGLGWLALGFKAFWRSLYGSLMFPAILFVFEELFPERLRMADEPLLYAAFGASFLGIGFGFVIKYGGTSGGTDIPIKILHRIFKLPLSYSLYIVDGAIILSGIIAFYTDRGITPGLYALLVMAISGRMADYVVVGSNTLKAVHIITDKPREMKQLIYDTLERGVSLVPTRGGYTLKDKTMLVSVITREEYYKVRNVIAEVDPEAFVFASPATEIQGDFTTRWEDD